MTDAHAKSFTKPTSRRSLLKGLGAAAVGISLLGKKSPAWAEKEKKLNFYNWDTYIGETTLETFKEKSGIDVNMSLFATNDELFAKLRAGNPGFDVIVPGSEFVERMIKANLLEPLDHAKIPNIKNIAPDIALGEIIRGVLPFVVLMLLAVLLICLFPRIATALPDYVMARTGQA